MLEVYTYNTLNNLSNDPIKQVVTFHFTDEKIALRSSYLSKITLPQYVPKGGFKYRYSQTISPTSPI